MMNKSEVWDCSGAVDQKSTLYKIMDDGVGTRIWTPELKVLRVQESYWFLDGLQIV